MLLRHGRLRSVGTGSEEDDQGSAAFGQIIMPPEHLAGVWANFARVSHSEYEFTLDFVRLDFSSSPPGGIVVARVSVSPLLVSQLIDALQSNWSTFAAKAMPREVFGGEDDDQGGAPHGEDLDLRGPAMTTTADRPVREDVRRVARAALARALRRQRAA